MLKPSVDGVHFFYPISLQEANGSRLRRLLIDSGTVYAKSVGGKEFVLIRIDDSSQPCKFYGRLANLIGIAIDCREVEGSGLNIHVGGAEGGSLNSV